MHNDGGDARFAASASGDSGWLVRLGRLGYAVKGVVYMVMGYLAVRAALGTGGETTDSQGALRAIGEGPMGQVALIVVVIGLIGYAAWRVTSAVTDAERHGDEPTSVALRIGDAVRGLAYGALGVWTFRFVTGGNDGESGNEARAVTDQAMELPFGRWIVIAAGIGIVAYAAYQLYRAATGKFMKRLDLSGAGTTAHTWVERFGKFGIAARGIVFAMIGVLVFRAGWNYNPSTAGGIEKSLDMISGTQGGYIFAAVAAGLIAFGLFQLATARYRVMRS